jgi:sortase (surface protein transpeptidase)
MGRGLTRICLHWTVGQYIPNHLDLNDVKLGDAVTVRVDESTFVTSINGLYRIMKMTINVDKDWNESVNLDMEAW